MLRLRTGFGANPEIIPVKREETPMAAPEFLICLNCESPCYLFEWEEDGATEAVCEVCGSEEVDQFLTPEDFDTLIGS